MFDIIDLSRAERESSILRMTILDESVPVEFELLEPGKRGMISGGRQWDAYLLGRLQYTPALQNLVEAAEHDLNDSMRDFCLDSIASMGKLARKCAPALARRLIYERSIRVRTEAARALSCLCNSSFEVTLKIRDAIEEARTMTRASTELGYFYEKDKEKQYLCWNNALLLQELLITLYKLDAVQGKEEIEKSLDCGCPVVFHHTKSARYLSGEWDARRITSGREIDWSKIINVPFTAKHSGADSNNPEF
jgi:hypothetical protein